MEMDVKNINDLTEFLLGPLRKWPGMFLGEPKISKLPNFITGYNVGYMIANETPDRYFGQDGFIKWYFTKKKIAKASFWEDPFLEEAGGNDRLALELFFKYLEEWDSQRKRV